MMRKILQRIYDPILFIQGRVSYFCLFLTLLILPQLSFSQHFEFTPELKLAYEKIINLQLDEGRELIEEVKNSDPENYLCYHIENYIDFFQCFIDEDEEYFQSIRQNKDRRIDKIQAGPKDSPYYRFSQAEILLQWALVRLKFEEYVTGLLEINKAIKLLEENDREFPDFLANKKSLSALHALVGTIPEKYKNMLSWVSSFNGTIAQGSAEINEVYESMDTSSFHFCQEVVVIKALIELHLVNDKQEAYKTIQNRLVKDSDDNPLLCFISANITHQSGRNDEAIIILESHKEIQGQHPLYYLDYLLGIYKLNRLDKDADRYIRKYLNYFEGQNYIKEAYQKLAWYEWTINGDSLAYKRNMQYCSIRGNDLIDEDRQAMSMTKEDRIPDRNLLKARLLSDGSYQSEALALLKAIESFERPVSQQIEYYYRSGRIAQGLGKYDDAERAYQNCLLIPFDKTQYYQTAASLQLGIIYEQNNKYPLAREFFEKCIALHPEQYKNSLHQKAKAGLLRLRE